jgi:hypothetical protein
LRWGIPLVVAAGRLHAQAASEIPDFARAVDISVRTSPDSLTVGDLLILDLRVEAPATYEITFSPGAPPGAQQKATVKAFELEEPTRITDAVDPDSVDPDSVATWIGRYTLAVYGVGDVTLPPWPVGVGADTQIAIVHTDSIRVFVESVLDDSLAAADLRDLKPQREIDVPLASWVVPAAVALLLLVVLLLWLRGRRRRAMAVVPAAPPRPAHEIALADLRKLESLRLPYDGRIKEHYVRLSEILRTYLEHANQFRLAALEETTFEILRELEEKHYKHTVVDEIAAMCEEADLVKFAKHEPTVEQCLEALERLRRFVIDSSKTSARFALRDQEPALALAGVAVASEAPAQPASDAAVGPDVAPTAPGADGDGNSGSAPPPGGGSPGPDRGGRSR